MPNDTHDEIRSPSVTPATTVLLSPTGQGLGTTSFLSFRYAFRFECQTQESSRGVNFTSAVRDVGEARVGEMDKGWEPIQGEKLLELGDLSADVRALLEEDRDLDHPPPHAAGWRMANGAMKSWRGLGGDTGWRLCWGQGSRADSVPFRFIDVQLMLFDTGLGYLTFVTQPTTDELPAWHDMLHHFRFFDQPSRVHLERPEARQGDGPRTAALAEIIRGLLGQVGVAIRHQGEPADWAVPAERGAPLHAFGCVSLRDAPLEDDARHRLLNRFVEMAPQSRALDPVPENSDATRGERLQYNDRAWFVATKDVAMFIGFDADRGRAAEFFRSTMPNHVRRIYQTIDLFTQYQWHCIEIIRLQTIKATSSLQRRPLDGRQPTRQERRQQLTEVRALLETVMAVRARGFFTEIARRRNHARFERFLRAVTRIDDMHRIAIDGAEAVAKWVVEEHHTREREERERGDEKRNQLLTLLTFFTVAGLPLQVVSSVLSVNVRNFTASHADGSGDGLDPGFYVGALLAAVLATGGLFWWLAWYRYRRVRDR